jgi:hypothetical protein
MRTVVTALALAAAAVVLGGCGSDEAMLPPATAAPPQQVAVDWVEPTSKKGPKLVFEVHRVDVLKDGWRAGVAIRNESGIPWAFGSNRDPAAMDFGVMLFVTGDLDELTSRNNNRDLPGLRRAQTVSPPLPAVLEPGGMWQGTISAPGTLAADRWLRVVFGPLVADGDPPGDLRDEVVWITDNAQRLRR